MMPSWMQSLNRFPFDRRQVISYLLINLSSIAIFYWLDFPSWEDPINKVAVLWLMGMTANTVFYSFVLLKHPLSPHSGVIVYAGLLILISELNEASQQLQSAVTQSIELQSTLRHFIFISLLLSLFGLALLLFKGNPNK